MIRFQNEHARKAAEEKIKDVVHRILLARDYETLAGLYARLSWQGFDAWLETAFGITIDESDDVDLLHALRFVEHVEAMSGAGKNWRG